ncbi:hypothetical protein EVAR_5486_1 [Eumeta japonica]|uniref:Uncharacterized protein n=1 Tax=Eumeta variegata TaxID=151549 RepID=A0A4C1T904_EUMVA|nr:hypothetical protein EVAR_5486_1 [Eumeta japonica]
MARCARTVPTVARPPRVVGAAPTRVPTGSILTAGRIRLVVLTRVQLKIVHDRREEKRLNNGGSSKEVESAK